MTGPQTAELISAIIAVLGAVTAWLHANTAHKRIDSVVRQNITTLATANKANYVANASAQSLTEHVVNHPISPAAGAAELPVVMPAREQVTGSAPEIATSSSSENLSGNGL